MREIQKPLDIVVVKVLRIYNRIMPHIYLIIDIKKIYEIDPVEAVLVQLLFIVGASNIFA